MLHKLPIKMESSSECLMEQGADDALIQSVQNAYTSGMSNLGSTTNSVVAATSTVEEVLNPIITQIVTNDLVDDEKETSRCE